jgi:hypothetical protein
MPTEPTPEELRTRLEQSFERWRRRLDEASAPDEQRDDEPDESSDES